jgi:hypothetical protein
MSPTSNVSVGIRKQESRTAGGSNCSLPMADPRVQNPVLLVVASFSRHPTALMWGRSRLEETFGPVGLPSPVLIFNQTRYYEPSMGTDLRKQFLAFASLVDPAELAGIKLHTNDLERQLAAKGSYEEVRPLNLDPGLLSLGKFMLATTKDQAHRIYLRAGIFAEVTLRFEHGAYEPWPWTYADYREPALHNYLLEARGYYKQRLQEGQNSGSAPKPAR